MSDRAKLIVETMIERHEIHKEMQRDIKHGRTIDPSKIREMELCNKLLDSLGAHQG